MYLKTKTEQVVDSVIDKIRKGALLPGEKIPSERELHEQLSVSRVVVRRALSILKEQEIIIKKVRYGSLVAENALEKISCIETKNKAVKVGFVFHYLWARNSYFYEIIHELKTMLPDYVELKVYFHNYLKKATYEREKIDVLFLDHGYSDHDISLLDDSDIFTIVMLRKNDKGNYLHFDNYGAGIQMGKMFSEYGHKTVAILLDYPEAGENEQRVKGFDVAARRYGVKAIHTNISINSSFGGGTDIRAAIEHLFSSHEKFTAILAIDDNRAFRVYDLLQNMDVSVPEDISLAGFNNNMFSSMLSVPLTSACFPVSNICKGILKAIKQYHESGNMRFQETIPAAVIVRESVKDLKL